MNLRSYVAKVSDFWIGAVYKDHTEMVWSTTKPSWREAFLAAESERKKLLNV